MSDHLQRNRELPLDAVAIGDRFWQPYQQLVRDVVLPYQWEALNDRIADAEPSYCMSNLRRAAGLEEGQFRGMVFQDHGLFPWMTAGENIDIALKQRFPGMSAAERRQKAIDRLLEVELDASCYDKFPKELSGGMCQRCGIARAFSIDPPILLMDEPFGALDAVTRARLQDMVLHLWRKREQQRKTIFFVTHDVDEALLLSTDIYVLGQSPSTVIYKHSCDRNRNVDRQKMFSDPGTIDLRNKLIGIINDEIARLKSSNDGEE